jgi:hypothetical protein
LEAWIVGSSAAPACGVGVSSGGGVLFLEGLRQEADLLPCLEDDAGVLRLDVDLGGMVVW